MCNISIHVSLVFRNADKSAFDCSAIFWQANVLTRKEGFLLVGGLINLLSLLLTEPSVREYVDTSVDVCGWVDMWGCECVYITFTEKGSLTFGAMTAMELFSDLISFRRSFSMFVTSCMTN